MKELFELAAIAVEVAAVLLLLVGLTFSTVRFLSSGSPLLRRASRPTASPMSRRLTVAEGGRQLRVLASVAGPGSTSSAAETT